MAGLDHRSIDWKQSARHRSLLCKEFRTERNHQIILALDTGYLMSEPMGGVPKLDHAINAGLLLAFLSRKAGDQVGLFAFNSAVRHSSAANPAALHDFAAPAAACPPISTIGTRKPTSRSASPTCWAGSNRRALIVLMTDFVDTHHRRADGGERHAAGGTSIW